MGFSVNYRSTRPVAAEVAVAIEKAGHELCRERTWLSCEPVNFVADPDDGRLFGGSKPNFMPHPDDAASAASQGLPDGTTRDLLDVLCQLSRDHGVDWEISHDYSNGPIGHIRAGTCDDAVRAQVEALGDLGDILAGELDDLDEEGFSAGEAE
jgi:hypothetical protein